MGFFFSKEATTSEPQTQPQPQPQPQPQIKSSPPFSKDHKTLEEATQETEELFKKYMSEVDRLAKERAKYFEASKEAYNNKNGKLAKELSEKGKKAGEEMEKAKKNACEEIFKAKYIVLKLYFF